MWYGTPHTQAFERKKGLRGLTNQPSEQLFKNSTWLTNIIHCFFIFNQQLPPPLQDTGVFEKKDSWGSPTHQGRIETSEQAAERWGSSRPFQAQCAVDARDVNTCWAEAERDKTSGLLKIVRLLLFFFVKVRGHKLPRNIEDKVFDECAGCEHHLRDINDPVIENIENVRSSEGNLSSLIR